MKTSIIIPALNEAESIGQVLAEIPSELVHEVIVVDGGSQDGTPGIAEAAGARVLHELRRGYGRACDTGLQAASGEVAVFLDADGADDPRNLPLLLEPIRSGRFDLVLGSRLAGKMQPGAMPRMQQFGNRISAALFRLLYRLPLTDLSPFRAVRRDMLLALDLQEMTFGWPTEMIARAFRQGWRILEVPVGYRPRLAGRSKISGTLRGGILSTYHIGRLIVRYLRD